MYKAVLLYSPQPPSSSPNHTEPTSANLRETPLWSHPHTSVPYMVPSDFLPPLPGPEHPTPLSSWPLPQATTEDGFSTNGTNRSWGYSRISTQIVFRSLLSGGGWEVETSRLIKTLFIIQALIKRCFLFVTVVHRDSGSGA